MTVFAVRELARVGRLLATHEERKEALLDRFCNVRLSFSEPLNDALNRLAGEKKQLESKVEWLQNGGLADRPKRWMPSLQRIAEYWGLKEQPFCVACGYEPPVDSWKRATGWLERAHIVDRVGDGLDVAWNMAPLCSSCHSSQPAFFNGDEEVALAWFGLTHGQHTSIAPP